MSSTGNGSPREAKRRMRPIRAKLASPKTHPGGGKGDRRAHVTAASRDPPSEDTTDTLFLQSCLEEHPHQRDPCPEVPGGEEEGADRADGGAEEDGGVEDQGAAAGGASGGKEGAAAANGLREVVHKFTRDQKNSREVLFLQQQFYQEDQEGGADMVNAKEDANMKDRDTPPRHSLNHGSSTNKLPWKFNSPSGHYQDGFYRRSPSFRRTPGASRPPPIRLYSSSHYGPPPRHPAPFWGGAGSRSVFQPGAMPAKMLRASDLGGADGGGGEDGMDGVGVAPVLSGAVQLMVSNLDYNISAREWKKILTAEFQQHVHVLNSYIQTQADNTNVAYIQVASTDEARYAISQFHRKKIGYKRIHVCLISSETNSTAANTRCEVVGLLKEVTGGSLPLFKFIEMFEKRYHRGISVSELYRMRDVIDIEEQGGTGRMVTLLVPSSTTATSSDNSDQEGDELEPPVCKSHCGPGSAGYAAALDSACLPNVVIQLRSFSAQVHTLLQTHDGSMPLMSFQSCYEAEFRALSVSLDGGVPVEHLISCVPGVKVAITRSGVKKIQWAENKPIPNQECGRPAAIISTSPLMTQQLSQFSREVVDLLKHTLQCRMSFSKFIPAYHHHFGRQCRVADYGYTKLMELFEAIPHVTQIIGSGSRRFVTLSHRTQVKRFSADLLRVLKSQASKQIGIMDLPIVYNKVICKAFDITEYGVCYIEDILGEMPESTVVVQGVGQKMVIHIPRREQTLEEGERTKQFAVEVVDLLRHSPQCRMPFNKFIPAYHHHFGKQCRVADYGFTKLIELFESIPYILKMEDEEDDKMLCLTQTELIKVLEDQMSGLLRSCTDGELPVPELLNCFLRFHGHSIRLSDYGVSSVCELIQLIPNTAMIETSTGRSIIKLVDHSEEQKLAVRVLLLLMESPQASMAVTELCAGFYEAYGTQLLPEILSSLNDYVEFIDSSEGVGTVVRLTTLQLFGRDVRTVLRANAGRLSLQHFEAVYAQHFGVSLVPPAYGYPSVCALLQAVTHVATIRGKGYRRLVLLTPEFQVDDDAVPQALPSVNMGATLTPKQTSTEPYAETIEDPCTEFCTEPCTDTTCTIHCAGTCVTSPSNDSGITDLHDFSPEDISPGSDSNENDRKVTKPQGSKAQRHLSFDPGNIPVPDMFSNYDQHMEPKTPSTDMLQLAAQFLPHDVPPTAGSYTGPMGYGLPGQAFRFPDRSYLPIQTSQQCQYMAAPDAYRTYVSYGQYPRGEFYHEKAATQEYAGYPPVVSSGKPTAMYAPQQVPPSPPPYPVYPLDMHLGVMPITCESLEASSMVCARTGHGISMVEKGFMESGKPKESAMPPLTVNMKPSRSNSPIFDDNNNQLGMPDAEVTIDIKPGYSDQQKAAMGGISLLHPESAPTQDLSPRKKRLAARFDNVPNTAVKHLHDISVTTSCKIEI